MEPFNIKILVMAVLITLLITLVGILLTGDSQISIRKAEQGESSQQKSSSSDSFEEIRKESLITRPNMCWYGVNGTEVCIPTVFIPGFMKSGTSFMWSMLELHPDIGKTKLFMNKEKNFFLRGAVRKGLDYYASLYNQGNSSKLLFDASPKYMMHPEGSDLIFSTMKSARFIILMRDPVDRAISHYNYQKELERKVHAEEIAASECPEIARATIEQIITEEYNTLKACNIIDWDVPPPPWTEILPGRCATLMGCGFTSPCARCFPKVDKGYAMSILDGTGVLSKGLYAQQISNFLEFFPKEQFLFIKYEEIDELGPAVVLNRICAWLGIPELVWENFTTFPAVNAHPHEDANPKTKAWLKEFFRIPNQRLNKILPNKIEWD